MRCACAARGRASLASSPGRVLPVRCPGGFVSPRDVPCSSRGCLLATPASRDLLVPPVARDGPVVYCSKNEQGFGISYATLTCPLSTLRIRHRHDCTVSHTLHGHWRVLHLALHPEDVYAYEDMGSLTRSCSSLRCLGLLAGSLCCSQPCLLGILGIFCSSLLCLSGLLGLLGCLDCVTSDETRQSDRRRLKGRRLIYRPRYLLLREGESSGAKQSRSPTEYCALLDGHARVGARRRLERCKVG